jgi:glyoxylase-like metal-dependent hydrolase (beta-lactamase superfamily II)
MNAPARVARVLAPNPSPMTLEGTNSYLILGAGEAIAIDPGPSHSEHVAALVALAAQNGCRIAAIAVTHGHPDHAPGAALLRQLTDARVYAHAAATFPHDRIALDGARIAVSGAELQAFDTPGHARDHLVFWFEPEAALFAGDVILGRGTTLIAPPDGDMRAYQATLRRLRVEFAGASTIFGGHGEPISETVAKIDEYLAHREAREQQVLGALAAGDHMLSELVAAIYGDIANELRWAAALQVQAYLIALEREGRVRSRDAADLTRASYRLSE